MFELIIGVPLILMALAGLGWMLYRWGYYKGIEDARLWQYEHEMQIDWEERANLNSNYEELPSLLKRQAE